MNIYLSGSSRELNDCKKYMSLLLAAGHVITHDWCAEVDKCIASGRTDADLSPTERRHHAVVGLAGVARCELFWLLAPYTTTRGAWVEMGSALALNRMVYVSGPMSNASIFCDLAHRVFATHDDAIAWIGTAPGRIWTGTT